MLQNGRIAKVLSAKTNYLAQGKHDMSSLKNTIDKIKTLEAEKKALLAEIEGLKKLAEAKAATLEHEVTLLHDEVKALKTIVNGAEPNAAPNKI